MLTELLVWRSERLVRNCTVYHTHMHTGRVRVRDVLTACLIYGEARRVAFVSGRITIWPVWSLGLMCALDIRGVSSCEYVQEKEDKQGTGAKQRWVKLGPERVTCSGDSGEIEEGRSFVELVWVKLTGRGAPVSEAGRSHGSACVMIPQADETEEEKEEQEQ